MENKHAGILLLTTVVLFSILVFSFNTALASIVNESCTHGNSCPMHATLFFQNVVSYTILGLLAALGIYITFFMKETKEKTLTEEKKKRKLDSLNEEETKIYKIIQREQGSTYQSDLVKETKLTKVKITRILDKLEGKGLLERRRRGMSNILILK